MKAGGIMYIENIIIGTPIVSFETIFSDDTEEDIKIEKEKTIWTDERFLPKILAGDINASYYENGKLVTGTINLGIAPSASEVRRNRKDLVRSLDKLDYEEIKYGKRRLYILVGLKDGEKYEE